MASSQFPIANTADLDVVEEKELRFTAHYTRMANAVHLEQRRQISHIQREKLPGKLAIVNNGNSSLYNAVLQKKRESMRGAAQHSGSQADRVRCILDWGSNHQSALAIPDIEMPFDGIWHPIDHIFPTYYDKADRLKRATENRYLPEPEYGQSVDRLSIRRDCEITPETLRQPDLQDETPEDYDAFFDSIIDINGGCDQEEADAPDARKEDQHHQVQRQVEQHIVAEGEKIVGSPVDSHMEDA